MLKQIKQCQKCNLYQNQPPLIEECEACDVMWVGLSAKKITDNKGMPLAPSTNTGKIIAEIEETIGLDKSYKTNLVKCAPLDDNSKLRYPKKEEVGVCIENLIVEIKYLQPKVIFLLGTQVKEAIEQYYEINFPKSVEYDFISLSIDNIKFVPIQHPSYIHIYKQKEKYKYIQNIKRIIVQNTLIQDVKKAVDE